MEDRRSGVASRLGSSFGLFFATLLRPIWSGVQSRRGVPHETAPRFKTFIRLRQRYRNMQVKSTIKNPLELSSIKWTEISDVHGLHFTREAVNSANPLRAFRRHLRLFITFAEGMGLNRFFARAAILSTIVVRALKIGQEFSSSIKKQMGFSDAP